MRLRRPTRLLGTALTLGLLAACATNPVTGKSELALVSESQEIDMGKQGAAEVAQSIGLYPDDAVQAYVSRVGLSLAAQTERPKLPWQYQVVDDPAVNAFALPGGYIFVTRGLLTHMTSEAELASVLGHESGHVAARHSVQQISRAQVATLGLGLGSILSSGVRKYGDVAGAGLGVLFLKFSRDDETQADQLGFRYALTDGYDVREMVRVFQMLDGVEKLGGGGRVPEWQSTHPNPGNRVKATETRIAAVKDNLNGKKVGGTEFLRAIDGMVYGDNPRQGFFQGPLFLHPDLRFQFRFPDGWKTQNTSEAVMAGSSAGDAVIELRGVSGSPAEAATAFFAQQGMTAGARSQGTVHGLASQSGEFSVQTDQGTVQGVATFLAYNGTTFQLVGYSTAEKFGSYRGVIQQSLGSFDKLTNPAALAAQPMRVHLERVPRAMTLTQFHAQFPSSIPVEEVALINGVGKDDQLPAGRTLKRVTGGSAAP